MPDGPKRDLIITRIIDAPVELVWQAWTEPEHIMKWWGPEYWTSPSAKVDLREGGSYLFAMQAPADQGGLVAYNTGTYTKIAPHERLEFTQCLADKDGNKIDPAAAGMPDDFPAELNMILTFSAIRNDMTELTVTECGWSMGMMYVMSYAGMNQSLDKLIASLK